VDGVFGFTRTDMLAKPQTDDCWGTLLGIKNSCQAPLSRSTAIPSITASTWTLTGGGQPRAYRDPQWGGSANAGWTKGKHNIKFGGEVKLLHQNHYETQPPSFTFTGGQTALAPGSPNNFNAFADFLLGNANARTSEAMTPMIGQQPTVADMADFRPGTLRSWQFGTYVRDQFELNRKMTVSLGLRWEYDPLSRRADRGLEVFNFTTNQLDICGVSGIPSTCGITVEKALFTPRLG
jgi:TonB dependent receptor